MQHIYLHQFLIESDDNAKRNRTVPIYPPFRLVVWKYNSCLYRQSADSANENGGLAKRCLGLFRILHKSDTRYVAKFRIRYQPVLATRFANNSKHDSFNRVENDVTATAAFVYF